jgi:hypothetical protein
MRMMRGCCCHLLLGYFDKFKLEPGLSEMFTDSILPHVILVPFMFRDSDNNFVIAGVYDVIHVFSLGLNNTMSSGVDGEREIKDCLHFQVFLFGGDCDVTQTVIFSDVNFMLLTFFY